MQAILQTKLHRPVPRGDSVRREALFTRMDAALDYPVVLLSAPAGYGKTTLAAHWLAAQPDLAAVWLSLDAEDNDAARFFAHLINGLARYVPQTSTALFELLARASTLDVLIAGLLNGLAELDDPLVIVLDDYHVIEQRPIHDALQQFMDRLPPRLHLMLLTRADPPLALARLRARNALLEIRMGDLRFDDDEAGRFFNLTTGKQLAPDQIAQIVHKSEGWAAALQLTALSLRRQSDVNAFVQSLSGAQRHIVDLDSYQSIMSDNQPRDIDTEVSAILLAPSRYIISMQDFKEERVLATGIMFIEYEEHLWYVRQEGKNLLIDASNKTNAIEMIASLLQSIIVVPNEKEQTS